MGQQQSKDELLYQQVSYGNSEGIKSLHREGAGLEWMDRDCKTPLILACMNSDLYDVAKTLIELGANVNAYKPGRNAGTPLHHAAKRGLDNTVKLLLSHEANPLVLNDDCQTPLEVARAKGFTNVVHTIENHICLFSGWLREFYAPGFLEFFSTQLVTRKVWAVILPTGTRNHSKPYKLELAVYSGVQDARPHTLIQLWKANLEDLKFHQSDPSVAIIDNATIPRRRRRRRARHRQQAIRQTCYKFGPVNEGDKQQLQWFCDACKGIPRATCPPAFLHNTHQASTFQATAPLPTEDMELAMAINASIQSAATTPVFDVHSGSEASASTSWNTNTNAGTQGMLVMPSQSQQKVSYGLVVSHETGADANSTVQTVGPFPDSLASAPPAEFVDDGPIHYPSVDFSQVDLPSTSVDNAEPVNTLPASTSEKKDKESSSCVVCLDAPVEGACIPCGHMAGCMSCLNEIKAKKWGCPVCRAKIDQVVRLYTV